MLMTKLKDDCHYLFEPTNIIALPICVARRPRAPPSVQPVTPPLFRAGWSMLNRPALVTALGSVGSAIALAFVAQLAILGSLGIGPGSELLEFQPLVNVHTTQAGATLPLRFDASQGPAVAQTRLLDQPSRKILAVVLDASADGGSARLALGWRVAEDSRRPTSAAVVLANRKTVREAIIPLVGHPRWQGTVTQMALALEGGRSSQIVVTGASMLPANPVGGAKLMAANWFGEPDRVVPLEGAAVRVLPLALWFAFIAMLSATLAALWTRRDPARRARALTLVAIALALLATALTLISGSWPGWTPALIGASAIASSLLLAGAPVVKWNVPLAPWQLYALALALFAVGATLSPVVAAAATVPAIILLAARVWPQWLPAVVSLLALLPPLAIAAAAQRLITLPAIFNPLVDPTGPLLTVATTASGLPGVALAMLVLHRLWPAPALTQRWASAPGAAAAWALTAAVCVLSVPRLAVLASDGSAYVGLMLPVLACLALAVAPRFQAVATSVKEIAPAESGKTEADLSEPALALLQGYADSLLHGVATQQAAVAHNALAQMVSLAPRARLTKLARLRLALAERNLVVAQSAADELYAQASINEAEVEALFDLAHRLGQHQRVIELGPRASKNPNNTRAIALAQLLTVGPSMALDTLLNADKSVSVDETFFRQEIAELHLLANDVSAAQQSLAASGIPFKSDTGEAYVNRLGWRAAGMDRFGEAIQRMATWHPKLAVAQAGMGELLLQQGNVEGARARFRLAMQLDVRLWPLASYLEQMPAKVAENRPANDVAA